MTQQRVAVTDVEAETIGWVLGNARETSADRSLRTAARFALAVSPSVHRAQVGRWESGATAITHQQVRQYEEVLGLREGHLLAMIDTLTRERRRVRATGHLLPPPSPTWWEETDALLDRAGSDERMSALDWDHLSAQLGARSDAFLRRRDWEHLLRRCTTESDLCTGLDYVLRDEAKMRMASHPRSAGVVLDMCDELLRDPAATVYGETLAMLFTTSGDGGVTLLLRHLDDPVGEAALWTMLWVLRPLIHQGRLTLEQHARVVDRAVGLLQDDSGSERVHRAAAALLETVDPERRRGIVGGLRGDARSRIAHIMDRGSALGDAEVEQLAREIESRLALRSPGGSMPPVLRRIVSTAASFTAEDARGTALTLLMLAPQGRVVGETYASVLRWALTHDQHALVDETLAVLPWLLAPSDLPTLLDLALDPTVAPTRAAQAAAAVGNCIPGPEGVDAEAVVGRVHRSALARMATTEDDPTTTARSHLYVLGMHGRFDVIEALAQHAACGGGSGAWDAVIRSWLDVPSWARPQAAVPAPTSAVTRSALGARLDQEEWERTGR